MTASVDPWMCQACGQAPVPALGETVCATCAAGLTEPQDRADTAIESAQAFLEASDAATEYGDRTPMLSIALALQGILVCQIELMQANASAASPLMMAAGTIVLPEDAEPQPQRGPKAWGQ